MSAPVGVIGGGGFGRALAKAAARTGRDVILWSRRRPEGENGESKISVTTDLAELADTELLFLAVPSPYVREMAKAVGAHLDGSHLLVHVSRGLVGDDLHTITQLLREETPARRVGALAGPLVADALERGLPGGGIVGSRFREVADAVREALGSATLRLYDTDDVIGVEVASAMVGLLVLTAGFAQGMSLGPATLAVLSTRGLAEAARIGIARGGEEKTFYGLAGIGDMMAALAGDERPELRLGRALAAGKSLAEAGGEAGANIEGVSIARRVAAFARRVGVQTPISAAVAGVIDGTHTPADALGALMARRVGTE